MDLYRCPACRNQDVRREDRRCSQCGRAFVPEPPIPPPADPMAPGRPYYMLDPRPQNRRLSKPPPGPPRSVQRIWGKGVVSADTTGPVAIPPPVPLPPKPLPHDYVKR